MITITYYYTVLKVEGIQEGDPPSYMYRVSIIRT